MLTVCRIYTGRGHSFNLKIEYICISSIMEFDLIAATDNQYGLSKDGLLPWQNTKAGHEDMLWFKQQTINTAVIMGRKTWESLPDGARPLPKRINIVISSNEVAVPVIAKSPIIIVKSFDEALKWCATARDQSELYPFSKCIVIGGAAVYRQALKSPYLRYAYITTILGDYRCDLKFPDELLVGARYGYCNDDGRNIYRRYDFTNTEEYKYLELLNTLLSAPKKYNRTKVPTRGISHELLSFNLYDACRGNILPLYTTKKVMWKSIYHELIWFLRGSTDTEYLRKNGVHIWDGNTTREFLDSRGLTNYVEGQCGPIYGYQWRNWNGAGDYSSKSYDQLTNAIATLKQDPWDRRIIVTAWNPEQLCQMVLPPCHYSFQFNVDPDIYGAPKYLNCMVNMRSVDVFCGLPFNCASYALLTHMVAHITKLTPGKLSISMCDVHLYENALEQAQTQLNRIPKRFPSIRFSDRILALSDLTIDNFANDFNAEDYIIEGYIPAPYIKVEMVV
jgi:dihydrofolate reductase/thymidylate synthase